MAPLCLQDKEILAWRVQGLLVFYANRVQGL